MYKIAVPVGINSLIYEETDWDKLICYLKKTGADTVFIGINDFKNLKSQRKKIEEAKSVFDKHGIFLAVWVGTLSFYNTADIGNADFNMTVDLAGKVSVAHGICPLDENFAKLFCEKVVSLLPNDIDTLMLDDDFRVNVISSKPKCFCPLHLRKYSEILGKEVSRDEMAKKAFDGQPNEYRDAYIKTNGDALRAAAWRIRKEMDRLKPGLRIALSSGPALWGADGIYATEIAEILAGEGNKPLLRMSGGPYWSPFHFTGGFNHKLSLVADFTRRQAHKCRDKDIEILAEGDTFPRPRFIVPAATLECFDTIIRADGNFNGILKYVLDYNSFGYEQGYIEKAEKNKHLYDSIQKHFSNKTATGINPYESDCYLKYMDITLPADSLDIEKTLVDSMSVKFLNDSSIPVTFEKDALHTIFGDNAKSVELERLKRGAILDLKAALLLKERGIDIGLDKVIGTIERDSASGHRYESIFEYFPISNERVFLWNQPLYDIKLKKGAKVLSQFLLGKNSTDASYLYENADGQRFFVLLFDAYESIVKCDNMWLFKSYCRQRQIVYAYKWITGEGLDAVCFENPYLYIMTKCLEDDLTVGLWNLSLDSIDMPVVQLSRTYEQIEFINCTGMLKGDKVYLSKLYAHEFCGFSVR